MNRPMNRIRLTAKDVQVGDSLPYAVYDALGMLMLREGCVIGSEKQLKSLLSKGMYIQRPSRGRRFVNTQASAEERPDVGEVRVYRRMDEFRFRVRVLLKRISATQQEHPGVIQSIYNMAQELHDICVNYQDIAVLAVHLFYHDDYLADHPLHAAILGDIIATQLGMADEQRLSLVCAALTHDVGLVPVMSQLARPEELDETQNKLVKEHPQVGVAMLRTLGVSDSVWLQAVEQHHERIDGSGYPQGLANGEISQCGKILMAADVYSALVRNRPYRSEVFKRNALNTILQLSNAAQLDRQVGKTLIKIIGLYPPGTLVRLEDERIAISIARGISVYKPELMVIGNKLGNPLPQVHPVGAEAIVHEVSPSKYRGLYPLVEKLMDPMQRKKLTVT
jgi:HD-GYP domain-containing protein (c-di-GMP phosphodiesterase class II)